MPQMSLFLHFFVTGKLMAYLKHLSVNPSGESPKGLHHSCREGIAVPQSAAATGFQQCGQQHVLKHCYATIRRLLTVVLSTCFELLASVCQTSHNNKSTIYCCVPVLSSYAIGPCESQANIRHHYACCWLHFALF